MEKGYLYFWCEEKRKIADNSTQRVFRKSCYKRTERQYYTTSDVLVRRPRSVVPLLSQSRAAGMSGM
jgi:hypothetical protein